jgi:hypothetical protein
MGARGNPSRPGQEGVLFLLNNRELVVLIWEAIISAEFIIYFCLIDLLLILIIFYNLLILYTFSRINIIIARLSTKLYM